MSVVPDECAACGCACHSETCAAEARVARLVAVLRAVEFSPYYNEERCGRLCPLCGERDHDRESCELCAAIEGALPVPIPSAPITVGPDGRWIGPKASL